MNDIAESPFRPLRLWPAVLLVVCMWAFRLVPQVVEEVSMPIAMLGFMGPSLCGLLLLLWWLLFSRATWKEKGLGALGLLVIGVATAFLSDKSIRGFGTMAYAVPWGMTAFALGLIVWPRSLAPRRTWVALLAALLGFGYWDLIRTDGIWGDMRSSFSWRWAPTAEDRFLETLADRPQAPALEGSSELFSEPEWPSFRGPNRDGVQPGVTLSDDWEANPPTEVWRIAVGPGWSSFSVAGRRLFTQEQRGESEVVVCYDAETGAELWAHSYESRFWEVVGGAGPRATPTLSDGSLYALGAEGLLFRLDPQTGDEIWRRDLRKDAEREPPTWGFSSSPLVVDDIVIVHAGGAAETGVLAYDCQSGEQRWGAAAGDHSYSSPQLSEIGGVPSVLMLTNHGLTVIDPADGAVLGEVEWEYQGYRVVQPLPVSSSSVLLGTAMGTGTRRVDLSRDGDQFTARELWTSRKMNPYYNDYVAHKGHLFGFDSNIFACVDLDTGDRKWKKGRYGNGQVLLLPESDQLLVISETGELVLLRADSEKWVELTRWQVLEGKTWNHPVLIGNRLYVRNGEQAAAFEMQTM